MSAPQTKQLTLRIPVTLIERAESASARDRSSVLRDAIAAGFAQQDQAAEIRELRERIERLTAVVDQLAAAEPPTPPDHTEQLDRIEASAERASRRIGHGVKMLQALAAWLSRYPRHWWQRTPGLPSTLTPQRRDKDQ
jgi:hypothetical protein